MLKKKSYYIAASAVILFIGVNLYLLLKEDSKAERTVYINEWTRIANGDVTQTFETEGVALPESEHYVYFDEDQGEMASIYVKEGEIVTAGAPLFSYDTEELEKQKTETEIEVERLESELDSVEKQTAALKKIDTKSAARSRSTQDSEVTVNVDIDISTLAESQIDESIAKAEAEERKLEADLNASKKQLGQLNKKIDNVTVYSDIDGIITRINKDLTAPVITIASDQLIVEGILSEQQMKDVEVGQKIMMYSELHEQSYEGIISSINELPREVPSIGKEPFYSFIGTFEEEVDETEGDFDEVEEDSADAPEQEEEAETESETDCLLVGANLQMNVIVEEMLDWPVVSTDSVISTAEKKYVYKLSADGVIERQEVSIALTFGGNSSVESGLAAEEVIAARPKAVPADHASFILPMEIKGLKTKELKSMTKKQYAKYILMGFLEN